MNSKFHFVHIFSEENLALILSKTSICVQEQSPNRLWLSLGRMHNKAIALLDLSRWPDLGLCPVFPRQCIYKFINNGIYFLCNVYAQVNTSDKCRDTLKILFY